MHEGKYEIIRAIASENFYTDLAVFQNSIEGISKNLKVEADETFEKRSLLA